MKMDAKLLDDEKAIEQIDKEGEIRVISNYGKALADHIKQLPTYKGAGAEEVVITGMGGSAIAGDYIDSWLSPTLEVPIYVWRDYDLPAFVDNKTLVIAISYSGNTEETLSAASLALKKGAHVATVSSGGELTKFASKNDLPLYPVPKGLQPRAALPFLLSSASKALLDQWIIGKKEWADLERLPDQLQSTLSQILPSVPLEKNESKQIAVEMFGKMPVIYGYEKYQCVARRFKTQVNENAKAPAKFEFFPELDHNEIEGWDGKDEILKQLYLILIRDPDWTFPYRDRISITMEEIRPWAGGYHELVTSGSGRLERMFDATLRGDMASIYLSVLRGIDPSPVTMIEALKKKLANIRRSK
ncbi:MAG TPA: bifunctional phosphoglucose/phosphomannose isomerase [Thermoprotei archaeon]|nr:bifunctional phosphoglucose/phosphomannose isomerase [Thermoprotei archaeon]